MGSLSHYNRKISGGIIVIIADFAKPIYKTLCNIIDESALFLSCLKSLYVSYFEDYVIPLPWWMIGFPPSHYHCLEGRLLKHSYRP